MSNAPVHSCTGDAVAGQVFSGEPPTTACCLSGFDALYAPQIASWVRSGQELTWLAPGTSPPLTASKVMAWGENGGHRFLLWCMGSSSDRVDTARPIGYAELNRMPNKAHQMWIGHFVLAPEFRGQGYGLRFVQALLRRAFFVFDANVVLLVVFPENKSAIRCYEKSGMIMTCQERKYFRSTRREHLFFRMEIKRSQFEPAAFAELSRERIPFVENTAQLRSGRIYRRRIINQA